jgi:glucosamine-phosphate N-acetyltransferase
MALAIGDATKEDLARGLLDVLESLSKVELTPADAARVLQERIRAGVRTFVAREGSRVVGTATLMIEHKFIHGGGRSGHIEDVAVHRDAQGQGIGAALVRHATAEAKKLGCYKVILNCADGVMPFYARLGFRRHDNGMRLDF